MPPILIALVLLLLPGHPEGWRETVWEGVIEEGVIEKETHDTGPIERPEPKEEEQEEVEPLAQQGNSGMGDGAGDVEEWRPLVAGHFGDLGTGAVERALCIMRGESGGNPEAKNSRSGASGLMQVMPFWADEFGLPRARLFEPEVNLWVARQIFELQGWGAWSVYNRGRC